MNSYIVEFTFEDRCHRVKVKAYGLIQAIEFAVKKHYNKYNDALSYEITSAYKVV